MGKNFIVSLFIIILGISSRSVFAVELQDSLALVALYDSANGDSWTNNTNWKVPDSAVSTWFGVTVTGNRVTMLDLRDNNLVGTVPPSIGDLDSLTYLNLRDNQLTDSIPPGIGNFTNLEQLYLNENQLTGSIPPEIGNLTSLRLLYLNDNQLTDSIPPEIGNLTNLEWLHLENNNLTGSIPPEICNIMSLELLQLNNNQLMGPIPPEIGNPTNLLYLYLHNNDLTGSIPPEIGSLRNLYFLYLRNNDLTGSVPPEIGSLRNLIQLYLDNNDLTGSIPPEIDSLTSLGRLHLHYNDLVDLPSLAALSSLEYLYIQGNKFTFEDIEPNIGVPSNQFIYSPQDSVGEAQDTTVAPGSSLTISVFLGGEYNLYQWKKDGMSISGAEDNVYTMDPVGSDDAGSYICEITNDSAPALTLYSRPINVTVFNPLYITVTTPNGGEDWKVDSIYNITWTSAGTSGNVQIEYSTNNGSDWFNVISSTTDDGTHPWTIPDIPSDSCLVRIQNWSGTPSDISDAVFTISPSSAVPPVKLPEVYSFNIKGITIGDKFEIKYGFPEKAEFILGVYDIKGTRIKQFSEENPAGFYSKKIDMSGKPAGVYFIIMEANGKKFTKINKVVLVK
jgi:Leucine-rich repeat (LRR) protein